MKKMSNFKTIEFINKLYNKRPYLRNKLKIIGKYIHSLKKIKCKNKYGELLLTPHHLLSCNAMPSIRSAVNKTSYFINQAIEIHKNKYNYDKVVFKKGQTKVIIICKKHGKFKLNPDSHLQGVGCVTCSAAHNGLLKIEKSKNNFFIKAPQVHNDFYNYEKFNYKNAINKSTIICPLHGEFKQSAHGHLSGRGCMKCAIIKRKPFYKNNSIYNSKSALKNKKEWEKIPACIYLIKCINENETFYKVGITRNKKRRFDAFKMYYELEIIKIFETNLYESLLVEEKIHSKLLNFKYIPKIEFGGHQECYKFPKTFDMNCVF